MKFFYFFLLILIVSCTNEYDSLRENDISLNIKSDDIEINNFFTDTYVYEVNPKIIRQLKDRNVNDQLEVIKYHFFDLHTQSNFLLNMIGNTGYCAWDYSIISNKMNDSLSIFFIPVVKSNLESTSGVLFGVYNQVNSGIKFELFDRDLLFGNTNYPNKETAILAHLNFDSELFGTTDQLLLNALEQSTSNFNQSTDLEKRCSEASLELEEIEICWCVPCSTFQEVDPIIENREIICDGSKCKKCRDVTIIIDPCEDFYTPPTGIIPNTDFPWPGSGTGISDCVNCDGAEDSAVDQERYIFRYGLNQFIEDNNIPLSVDELETIVDINCLDSSTNTLDFSCASLGLINYFENNYPDLELTDEAKTFLETNPEISGEGINFLNDRSDLLIEARLEALEIYTELLASDTDFNDYALNQHPSLPAWMWPAIREIGVEIAIELLKRHGFQSYISSVINGINNLSQGDVLGFLGEVLEIVKKVNPAFKTIDMTLDGIELTSKAAKSWMAIVRLKKYGSTVLENVLSTVTSRLGGLIDIFKYRRGNIGVDIVGENSPIDFFHELIGKFPNATFINSPIPGEIIYEVAPSIKIKFYPTSNSTNSPTIEIKLRSSFSYKMRF